MIRTTITKYAAILVVRLVIISTITIPTDSHPSHQPSTTTRTPKCKHDRIEREAHDSTHDSQNNSSGTNRRTTIVKRATERGQPAAQQEEECISSRRQRQDSSSRTAAAEGKPTRTGSTGRHGERERGRGNERSENGSIDARRREQQQGTYAAINQKTIAPAAIAEETAEGWKWMAMRLIRSYIRRSGWLRQSGFQIYEEEVCDESGI